MPSSTTLKTFVLLAFAGIGSPAMAADADDSCTPLPTPGLAQYVFGYGSLTEEGSRRRTAPAAATAWPVRVQGLRRAWIGKSASTGFGTTFLSVTLDAKAMTNGVLFPLADDVELTSMDLREASYCRTRVSPARITMLNGIPPPDGEFWVYFSANSRVAPPSRQHPIVQSYVDLFLTGCLQIERKYQLEGFAEECIASTHGWSRHWVNDRIYPRRPFIHQPNASIIDALLQRKLPEQFKAIRIE